MLTKNLRGFAEGRIPSLEDRNNLPYCDATIMEIQRLSCVAPGALPHIAKDDGHLAGYKISRGTLIMYNIYKFHMDPNYWEDPEIFNPGRFLDGKKKEHFVPYGMGKRICMGESLAKNELFIFFTIILQNLKIGLPIGREKLDPERADAGIVRVPKPFHINISARE